MRAVLLRKCNGRYFNWDYDEDRQNILQQKWSRDDHLLIFDEGIYDIIGNEHSILVTGYRRGGDSLLAASPVYARRSTARI